MALHEQNKSSLEGFDKDIERAFRTLQVGDLLSTTDTENDGHRA